MASQSRWAKRPDERDKEPSSSSSRGSGLAMRRTSKPLGGKSLDRMALLASPSRGLDASLSSDLLAQGSMDLTDHDVQTEFRAYISSQIASRVIPTLATCSTLAVLDPATYLPTNKQEKQPANKVEDELQQVLLLTRKLREAVVASKRQDAFVVEVYGLSVHIALLCMDVPQLMTSLPRLVLDLMPEIVSAGTHDDVSKVLEHTKTPFKTRQGGSMQALLLLQTLCLSGKATRLGQYAAMSSVPVSAVLREYRQVRSQLVDLYSNDSIQLDLCDQVYVAVRDSDPFTLARILERNELDIWQRILLLQLVPSIRAKAWAIARKAYMYLPVSATLASQLNPQLIATSQSGTNSGMLADMLLLTSSLLPPLASSKQARPPSRTPPEDWDQEDAADQITTQLAQASLITDDSTSTTRLRAFLESEFAVDSLVQRVMSIREGFAIKIR